MLLKELLQIKGKLISSWQEAFFAAGGPAKYRRDFT